MSYQMTGYTYVFYTRKTGQGGSLVLPSGLRFCGFCPQGVPCQKAAVAHGDKLQAQLVQSWHRKAHVTYI